MTQDEHSSEQQVRAVDLHDFEGVEVWQPDDERGRLRGYFPLSPGTPNASGVAAEDITVVSIEIQPGDHLPTHRDSAEELLVVTEGTVEAWVSDQRVEVTAGQSVVVPEMEPHGIENVGDEVARVLGVFPQDHNTATFEAPLEPFGTNVVSVGGDGGEETSDESAGGGESAGSEPADEPRPGGR